MNYSISTKLIQLCRAHRKIAESKLNEIGLYAGQEAILLCLLESDGLSLSELANSLGVEAPTMTKAVARLEKGGFVARQPDPEDGRISRVYITDAGQQLEEKINGIWSAIEARLTDGLSAAEKVLLERLLPELLNNLQTN